MQPCRLPSEFPQESPAPRTDIIARWAMCDWDHLIHYEYRHEHRRGGGEGAKGAS